MTENIQLKNSDSTFNKFERGRVDLFNIENEEIGNVIVLFNFHISIL